MSGGALAFDLAGVGLVLLAAGWGVWRGATSQVLSFACVVGALVGARWLGPRLEQPLAQASAVEARSLPAAGWVLGAALLLLALSLLVRLLQGLRKGAPEAPTRLSRTAGGLLGAVKGLLLLFVVGYGVLYAAPPEQARAWGAESRLLPALARLRPPLARLLSLPACTDEAAGRVEGWLPRKAGPSGS
ncbi:MAG: CvpA family protein [Planctomycetia bacterium]